MRYRHNMPFGAQCLEDGRIRFRLWAPKAKQVTLRLESSERERSKNPEQKALDLIRNENGWFEIITGEARAGSRYRYVIDGQQEVPDPASRFQPVDVNGPSEVVDPLAFEWENDAWEGKPWTGRSWNEAILYELHVGTFTQEGTFAGVEKKLDYLCDLGITAVELMPLSDFSGRRNWGYDGVLPYAPDDSYGTPEDLKRLIQEAHRRGLMIFLDVVYNHFGPEGNYLCIYAPEFFTDRHRTPWGEGINFDGGHSCVVRDFFIHNALYWLEEYQFDGLRLDAVHAIADDSHPDILTELAETVRRTFEGKRRVHLVLENENNAARYLQGGESRGALYDAQWNDDIHHALHVLVTGETDGYYSDYAKDPIHQLGRCLAEGFAYQNDPSDYRGGSKRGELSGNLPPRAFVSFLQNHDQIGNRAFGDRIVQGSNHAAVKAAAAILLLAPSPPLLFMGEEFGACTPFLFFSDFRGELATAVREGRRNEFRRFARFKDPQARAKIPDPNAERTFLQSKLNWKSADQPEHQAWLRFHRALLSIRRESIWPLLRQVIPGAATFQRFERSGLFVQWPLNSGRELKLLANLGELPIAPENPFSGDMIYSSQECPLQGGGEAPGKRILPPWTVVWSLSE
jgi:maltooligosyltrehalose trehalohydrolase